MMSDSNETTLTSTANDEADTSNKKVNQSPNLLTNKKAAPKLRKLIKVRFLRETNLHKLKREDIYKYIVSLHKRLRLLLKKCKKYRERLTKLVSCKV